MASTKEIWAALDKIYKLSISNLSKHPNIIRIFNGLILLGRNLVSVDDVMPLAWDSGCVSDVFDLISVILRDNNNKENQTESTPSSTISIQALMSKDPENEKFYSKLFVTSLQFISNLSVQASYDLTFAAKIFGILMHDIPSELLKSLIKNTPVENSIPLLLIVDSLTRNSSVNCLKLVEEQNGQLLLQFVLENSDTWFGMQNDMYANLVSEIILHIINHGYAATFLLKALASSTLLNPEQTYSFIKLIHAGIVRALEPSNTSDFYDPLLDFAKQKQFFDEFLNVFGIIKNTAVPFIESFPQYKNNPDSETPEDLTKISNTWNVLLLLLDIFEGFFTAITSASESLKYTTGESPKIMFDYIVEKTEFLNILISLLHTSESSLPKRNKLSQLPKSNSPERTFFSSNKNGIIDSNGNSDIISNQDENDEDNEDDPLYEIYNSQERQREFPLIKNKMIFLLCLLGEGNFHVQELARNMHALEIVLSNMMIDQNNPFIRQTSVLCISVLLKNNPSNQDFVSKLEAKEAVPEKDLQDAGFNINVVDGKVKFSKN